MKYTTLSDDDMDVVQKFAFGGIANPIQRPFLRSADKEFLAARQAELDAFEQQRQAYNTGLAKYQEEVYKPYQQQAEAYNAAAKQYNTEVYEPYQQQFNAYEKAVSDFNAGDRTSDYAGPAEPTLARAFEMQAPTTPGSFDMTAPVLPFKEEDVVARQQQAAQTARKDAGDRATAINVVSNPEQFGFGSMSVSNRFMAEGGPVDKDTGPSARDMLDGMSGSDDGKMDRVVRELSAKGKMSEEAIMDAVTRVSNAGRGGDELLAYLSPESMAFLKSQGGSGTVNPETGLPEFFIKSLIKAVQRAFGGGGSAPAPAPQAPPPPPTAAEQLAALQKSVDGLQSQLKETPETIRVRRGLRKRTVENPAFAQLNSQLTTARGQLDEFMKTYKPEPAPAAPAPLPMSTAATAPTAPTAQQIANTPGMGTGGIGVNIQPLPMSTAATTPTVTRQQPLPPAPNPEALFNPPPPAFVGPVQQTPAAPPPPPPPVVRDPRAISGPAGGAASQTTVGPNAAALLSSINAARPLAAVELGRAVPGTTRPATGGQPTAPGAPPKQSGGLDTSYQPGAVAQPQFVDYSSRGVGSVGTAQQNLSMPMFNDFQRSQAVQATRPSNYFAQSQPGTLGNTPGTTALGSGNAPLPMAFNTMNAIDANRNLSPGMLGGMQNAGVMTDRLGNRIFSPGMVPGFAKGGLAEAADVEEDDRPINTDPLGSAQQYMAQLADANKPSPTRQSVKRLAKNTGGASAPKEMGMSTEPLASAKDLVPQLSDKGSSRQQMEEFVQTYQRKINAAKNKARGLSADTFGAPTLEGPSLTKNTLAKKRFAKGGEAKKSDVEVARGTGNFSDGMFPEYQKGGVVNALKGTKAVDKSGKPVMAYRGEYGPDASLSTRSGSLTFGSKDAANLYATSPNNSEAAVEAAKVFPSYLSIRKPFLTDPGDPFVDLGVLRKALGQKEFERVVKKNVDYIERTGGYDELATAKEYMSALDVMKKDPKAFDKLYMEAHPVLDDPRAVKALQKRGYDGAIYGGSGATAMEAEYRVFSPSQAISPYGNKPMAPRSAGQQLGDLARSMEVSPTDALGFFGRAAGVVGSALTPSTTNEGEAAELARRRTMPPTISRADGSPKEGEMGPAFVTPKSGKGRKSSAKTGELEAAALQGISETPYNLLGAPVDLATMAMRPFGYNVQAPMLGSEDLKRRATKAGIRQEPPKEGTAARALYNLAEIGSSAVNPAAPVRAGMKAAKAVGDKATDVAKDFQEYNRQLTVPGASYAVRQNNPQFIPNKILEGTLERSMPPDIVGQRPAERLQELRRTFGEEAVDTGRGLAPEVETPVLRARDQLLRESALDKWVNTTLRKYISRDMATPKDPVREMAEQGVLAKVYEDNPGTRETARRKREDLGMAPEGLAQTEAARMWEDVADVSFRSTPAEFFTNAGTEASFLADNPWIARLDPSTMITRAGTRMAGEPQDTFQHIVDVLKSDMEMGKIRPESLNKMSMADAVKRAHDYNLEKVKAAADARKAAMADRPVYRKYDGDYQWIQLTKPGDFANESDAMGHSVRGYEPMQGSPDWRESSGTGGFANYGVGGWEGIKSGKAKVYSLRDASGDPHGTIEVMSTPNASPAKFRERGISYAEASDAAKRAIGVDPATEAQFIQTLSGEQRMQLQQSLGDALAKEFFARTGEMPMESHILQIKGKGNEPLSPKYQKYAQDFVQKGNWDSVSDLGNAGLHQTPKGYMTSSEIIDLFQTLPDNVRNSGFVQERINNLKSNANPNYDYYDAYLYAKQTF